MVGVRPLQKASRQRGKQQGSLAEILASILVTKKIVFFLMFVTKSSRVCRERGNTGAATIAYVSKGIARGEVCNSDRD